MNIECVSPFLIDRHWHHIQPHLKKGCKRTGGEVTPAWLYEQCRRGKANYLLFIDDGAVKMCAVVTFDVMGGSPVAYVNINAGGTLKIWRDEYQTLKDWCAEHGAESLVYDAKKTHDRLFGDGEILSVKYKVDIA